MKILILGGGLQGLSCGEALYNKGYVIDIVSDELQIVHSKFFRKVYSKGYNSIDDSVLEILHKEKYDIVIPMGDMNVSYLSKHKEQIETKLSCKCACPSHNLLEIVEDKNRFMCFCKDNDIPHPKTKEINENNLEQIASYIGFPALIKPNFSVGARGITRVDSLQELIDKSPAIIEKYGECTLQELIENLEYYYNVMIYRDSEGHILASAIIKIVRMYPVRAGSSSCCISEDIPELIQLCTECLEKLNWIGMADFDVLQRLDSGEYKIIEINPRVPASLRGAYISGINFPEIIVKDLIKEEIPEYRYKCGKIMRYIGLDIMWFMKSSKRFKSHPSWFCFFGKNIYYQDILFNDRSTWWTWLVEGLKKISRRKKRLR